MEASVREQINEVLNCQVYDHIGDNELKEKLDEYETIDDVMGYLGEWAYVHMMKILFGKNSTNKDSRIQKIGTTFTMMQEYYCRKFNINPQYIKEMYKNLPYSPSILQ